MKSNETINKVLVTVAFPEHHLASLRRMFEPAELIVIDKNDSIGITEALKEVEAAVLFSDLDERFLEAPKLRWVHCDHAGLNKSARPEVFERGLTVTSSAGRSGPVLAEHVMFFALAHAYNYPAFYQAQKNHQWGIPGQEQQRGLYGKTMGIIGMGNTGTELAGRAKAFGMKVLGYKRSVAEPAPGVDRLYCRDAGETLDVLLQASDFVALALPLSDTSHHLIGKRELGLMKSSACLINLARGAVIDEEAMLTALREGRLAGAGLDTFKTEPLPTNSPLWDAPNMLITPHFTPAVPDRIARSLDIIAENVRRYRANEPMINVMQKKDMYTKDLVNN
jgi:phosphoglycerate dehydrogenase-like enzyme